MPISFEKTTAARRYLALVSRECDKHTSHIQKDSPEYGLRTNIRGSYLTFESATHHQMKVWQNDLNHCSQAIRAIKLLKIKILNIKGLRKQCVSTANFF